MVHIELSKCGMMSGEWKTHTLGKRTRPGRPEKCRDTDVAQGLIDASEADPKATLEVQWCKKRRRWKEVWGEKGAELQIGYLPINISGC